MTVCEGKRVLVTGAGGSIGAEICREVLRQNPEELVMLGHGENSLFEAHEDLVQWNKKRKMRVVVADIRDEPAIRETFERHKPDVVFHAAAHKHVPLMEGHVRECITNNVFGTLNVRNAALSVGTQRFVLISTDKAVNPSCVMGATKRVAELIVKQGCWISGRPYCSVRFGNVLGTRGSVLKTWEKQLKMGVPLTVTDVQMERYFMSVDEAVHLVMQAARMCQARSEVFMLDMGERVKIFDLALKVQREADKMVGIELIGMRDGEKMVEELSYDVEEYVKTENDKIVVSNGEVDSNWLNVRLIDLRGAAKSMDREAMMVELKKCVPEYRAELVEA